LDRKLITSDCHIAAPFSLVDELPESYREFYPRVDRRGNASYVTWPHRSVSMTRTVLPGESIEVEDTPAALARAAVANVCPEAEPSFDPAKQLADLERDGVYGAVLIGRISVLDAPSPPEADAALCRLVNDWLAETWGPYLDRVAPGIYLPFKDVAASVKELERAAGMGLRPGLLPHGIFGRPYHLPEWEPLWEAANALKIPLTMHIGALRRPPSEDEIHYPGRTFVNFYDECFEMGEALAWLLFAGVFERYPDLHVVMTEGQAGWLAFEIEFLDHLWEHGRFQALIKGMDRDVTPKLEAPPSVYLKRQAHATFMWDPLAVRERDITGIDCLLWGNDYPHNEGSFPYSPEWIDKQFAGVPDHEVEAIVHGNAARIFNLKV